ncbi:MAG: hypothetical protein IKR60_00670 [Alphaproteobacteria bacterium]|nr:hypothetical protein [Alphaproteobacteria bacterium]
MKRYIILVLSILFILKITTTRILDLHLHRVCPLTPTSESISSNEAEIFLTKWQKYQARGYAKKIPEDFSYDDVSTVQRLPWLVKQWFEQECINPQRFYYVEQRLRTILKALQLKKHNDHVIKILSEQMAAKTDEQDKAWYKQMIDEQGKMSKVEGITDEEFAFIAKQENRVKQLLE